MIISFFVPGEPKTAGSKRSFQRPGMKFPVIVDTSGQPGKDWRGDVKRFASEAFNGEQLLNAPLSVTMSFIMPRPKYHYRSNGAIKPNAPVVHYIRPDLLKMTRAVEDALTGVIWTDDALICSESMSKRYGDKPGCHVVIRKMEEA